MQSFGKVMADRAVGNSTIMSEASSTKKSSNKSKTERNSNKNNNQSRLNQTAGSAQGDQSSVFSFRPSNMLTTQAKSRKGYRAASRSQD